MCDSPAILGDIPNPFLGIPLTHGVAVSVYERTQCVMRLETGAAPLKKLRAFDTRAAALNPRRYLVTAAPRQ